MTQQELLVAIENNINDLKHARLEMIRIKKMLDEADGKLIELKLEQVKLVSALREMQMTFPAQGEYEEAYDQDIERFKLLLPELLKKV